MDVSLCYLERNSLAWIGAIISGLFIAFIFISLFYDNRTILREAEKEFDRQQKLLIQETNNARLERKDLKSKKPVRIIE